MSKNLTGERDCNAWRDIGIARLNGDAQCTGDRAGMVLVAADRRRVQPSVSVDVHAGGKGGAAGASAWGVGSYVHQIHQDGVRGDVVRTEGWERCCAGGVEYRAVIPGRGVVLFSRDSGAIWLENV